MPKNTLAQTILILCFSLLVAACEQKQPEANESIAKQAATSKFDLKPDCLPSTGSAMEDGEVTVCYYNTDALALAYASIVKENSSKEDFGYALLQKSLPAHNVEDKFDDKETWINYVWHDKTHVTVTIQMAGGEDTLEFSKEKDKVKVVTTLSAD